MAHDPDDDSAVIREAQFVGGTAIDRSTLGGDLLQDAGPMEDLRTIGSRTLHDRNRATTDAPALQIPQ